MTIGHSDKSADILNETLIDIARNLPVRTAHDRWRYAWFASDVGMECNDITTLESATNQKEFQNFLTGRLERAFAAGWDGCHTEVTTIITDTGK